MPFYALITLITTPNKLGILLLELADDLWEEWKKDKKIQLRRHYKENWPVLTYIATVAVLLFYTGLSGLFALQSHSPNWRLHFWICAASTLVSLLPLAVKVFFRVRHSLGIVLEVSIFALTLVLFAKLILGLPFLHRWTLCAGLLTLLLSAGGRGIEIIHDSISARLTREWNEAPGSHGADASSKNLVKSHLALIHKYFIGEAVMYCALPVGTLVGLFFCWVLAIDSSKPLEVVTICLRCVFGLAGIIVIRFLVSSSIRMSDPVLRVPMLSPNDLTTGTSIASDWGCILTEYRKMFFFDAMLDTALLLTFGVFEWFLWNQGSFSIRDPKFVAIIVVISVLLNEIPYLIGQKRVQEKLVFPYRGWEKSKKITEVAENIPLVLKFEFIAALIGEASAGGLALEMMKQITEAIGKQG